MIDILETDTSMQICLCLCEILWQEILSENSQFNQAAREYTKSHTHARMRAHTLQTSTTKFVVATFLLSSDNFLFRDFTTNHKLQPFNAYFHKQISGFFKESAGIIVLSVNKNVLPLLLGAYMFFNLSLKKSLSTVS
jgi:hypothetical protein